METGEGCLTTNCCGQKDYIKHKYYVLLHEPCNSERIADLLKSCHMGRNYMKFIGKNANKAAEY